MNHATSPTLFDHGGRVAHNGTATSKAAAVAIAPSTHTLRVMLLDWLRKHGPATDEQMQRGVPMAANTQRPRRGELREMKLVRDTGRRGTTEAGRSAILWEYAGGMKEAGNGTPQA